MKILYALCALFLAYQHNINSFSPLVSLETERLALRPVQVSDLKDIADIALNPLVTEKTIFFGNAQTPADVENFMHLYLIGTPKIAPRYAACWTVIEKKSQKLVGW